MALQRAKVNEGQVAQPSQSIERRLLLVIHTLSHAQKLGRMLRGAGYRVDSASNPQDAVTAAGLVPYPLIVVERRLSGVDGYAMIQRLHSSSPQSGFLLLDDSAGATQVTMPELKGVAILSTSCSQEELFVALQDMQAVKATPSEAGAESGGRCATLEVLLIEGCRQEARLTGRFIARALGRWPHRCQMVATLAEALSVLNETSCELIFSELALADSEGLETIGRLRHAAPDAAIVALTAVDDEDLAARIIERGAQDYLVKDDVGHRLLMRTARYALERVRTQKRLSRIAYFDPLTGLANRITFQEQVAQAVEKAKRTRQGFSLMFLDLDRFKSINDTYGHYSGDQLLVQVAARLKQSTRPYDTVARLGGDEFAILLDDSSSADVAEQVARRIIEALERPVQIDGTDMIVTASIGIAQHTGTGESGDDLMRVADTAMYQAKAAGRSRYQLATSLSSASMPVQRLQNDLRRAVASQEFFLQYQPQIDLRTGKAVAMEALLRWRLPDGTTVMPDRFVPQLEETGLIRQVGMWTLQTACAQLAVLRGKPLQYLRIAINISAQELVPELPAFVQRTLEETGACPSRLELEVTESSLMKDAHSAQMLLAELQALGLRVAIDDFGTGYSSLSYLEKFRVNTLKLDKSFTQAYEVGARSALMLSGVIALAQQLELEVVAEGIETLAQLNFLRAEGCKLGQGYLFSRATDLTECINPTSGMYEV